MSESARRAAWPLALLLTLAGTARAADEAPAAPDPLYDPQPLNDDVTLPLPCDGKLVLRYIYVLARSALDDREVNLGYAFSENDPGYRQGFLAGFRRAHINGQFELADLPPAWRERLAGHLPSGGDGLRPMLYFIGKYEVTQYQYAAVMAQEPWLRGTQAEPPACPKADARSRLPMVEVSWYDALRFTALYTQWLGRTHADALPALAGGPNSAAGGAPSFVRLPTETEWEFAARGGHAVDRQALEARLFPRRSAEATEDGPLREWAVYNQVVGGSGQAARLAPIGTRKPNPAGLFDVIGNAAEMVLDPFLMVRGGGRFGGGTGGFIVKGGNYLEGEQALFTGMRREYPLFGADGSPSHNATTGFRVALGTLAAPRARYDELLERWQAEGRLASLTDDITSEADAGARLDAIIANTDEPRMARALTELSEELKRNVALIADQRKEAAGNLIQSAALVAETIGNYNIRLIQLRERLDKARRDRNQAAIEVLSTGVNNGTSALQGALSIYLDNAATGARYADDMFRQQFQRVQDELARKPVIGQSLLARATLFMKHVEQYRQARRLEPEPVLNELLGR